MTQMAVNLEEYRALLAERDRLRDALVDIEREAKNTAGAGGVCHMARCALGMNADPA